MAASEMEERQLEERRLKAELWKALRRMVRDQVDEEDVDITPSFLIAMTEMVWDRIADTTDDLIMFAKHGRHAQIQPSDVLLLGRRNAGLESVLTLYMDNDRQHGASEDQQQQQQQQKAKGTSERNSQPERRRDRDDTDRDDDLDLSEREGDIWDQFPDSTKDTHG
uniref:Uncharacterized protein n=1 Tax=Coccidioides posadasii RMSCC 3488 TaxID=454284 RepID=A0A0J6FBA3_COCPO|nr:hypothetical protein CPAG_02873 [Coccidioides posadasii RMSCC 3488]